MEPTWEEQLQTVLNEAIKLRNGGDEQGAVRVLERASDPVKAFGTWHYARGTLALLAEEIPLAIKEFEAAVQMEPDVPEFKANLGAALIEKFKRGDKLSL